MGHWPGGQYLDHSIDPAHLFIGRKDIKSTSDTEKLGSLSQHQKVVTEPKKDGGHVIADG